MERQTIVAYGQEFEIVWNGTLSREGLTLLPARDTKVGDEWSPPPRPYNKTGRHVKRQPPALTIVGEVDNEDEVPQTSNDTIPPGVLGWAERTIQATNGD